MRSRLRPLLVVWLVRGSSRLCARELEKMRRVCVHESGSSRDGLGKSVCLVSRVCAQWLPGRARRLSSQQSRYDREVGRSR